MDAIVKGQQIDLVTRQSIAKEILRFTVGVLDALSIPFYLIGGSALGAVRHGDIIPWDDDIDIGVLRGGLPSAYRVFSCRRALCAAASINHEGLLLADGQGCRPPNTPRGAYVPCVRGNGGLHRCLPA